MPDLYMARDRIEDALVSLAEAEHRLPTAFGHDAARVEAALRRVREAIQDTRLLLGADE